MKQSSDGLLFERPEQTTVELEDLPAIVFCPAFYHGSDMGYSSNSWSIKEIYDRDGNPLKPVFKEEWTKIAPGVATLNPATGKRYLDSMDKCDQAVRIAPEACPVRVVFEYLSRYTDYDWGGSESKRTVQMVFRRK